MALPPEDEYRQMFMQGLQTFAPGEAVGGGRVSPGDAFMAEQKAQKQRDWEASQAEYNDTKSPTDPSILSPRTPEFIKNLVEPNKAPAPDTYAGAVAAQRAAQPSPAPIDQQLPPEMAQQQQAFTPQFRPAGSAFVKTGEQTTSGLRGPDVEKLRDAANDVKAAQEENVTAKQQGEDATVKVIQEKMGELSKTADESTKALRNQQQAANWMHDMEAMRIDNAVKAEGSQKYNDSMMSRNPLQAIGFAIAAGVQAYANGMLGKQGPNEVLGMMEKTMNRDFATWQAARGQKRAEIEDRVRGLQGIDKQNATKEQQLAAFRDSQYAGIEAWANKMLADKALPFESRQRIMAFQEQAAQKRFENASTAVQLTGDRTSETKSRVSTGGGGAAIQKASKEQMERYIPAFGGSARADVDAQKLRAQTASSGYLKKQLPKVTEAAKDVWLPGKILNKIGIETPAVARLRQAATGVAQDEVTLAGGGAATKDEAGAVVDRLTGGLPVFGDHVAPSVEELENIARREAALAESQGIQKTNEQYVQLPDGSVVPVSAYRGSTVVPVPSSVRKKGK